VGGPFRGETNKGANCVECSEMLQLLIVTPLEARAYARDHLFPRVVRNSCRVLSKLLPGSNLFVTTTTTTMTTTMMRTTSLHSQQKCNIRREPRERSDVVRINFIRTRCLFRQKIRNDSDLSFRLLSTRLYNRSPIPRRRRIHCSFVRI